MFDDLNECGLKDGLTDIQATKRAIKSQLQNAEQEMGRYEAEAQALRKVLAMTEMLEGHMRGKLERLAKVQG